MQEMINLLNSAAFVFLLMTISFVCTIYLAYSNSEYRKEVKKLRIVHRCVLDNYDELVASQSKWLAPMQATIDSTAKLYNQELQINVDLRKALEMREEKITSLIDNMSILKGENNRLNGLLGKRVDPPSSFGTVKENKAN